MLDKTYDASAIEAKWYDHWESSGAFKCGHRDGAEPYTIVIPPPNVTGNLHMGHALDNTLQDILIRFERLRGKDTLWQVGTDHAGIATQMVVERALASQELDRRDMGREAFLEHVWEWKAESGGAITRQLRRLGASCDWSRERFTMDEGFSAAVLKVFVELHKQGLLYRDKRLVNWDPKFKTAISDLEVEQIEKDGHFWHFRYPIEGEDGKFIHVATTRPETMLGDTAVAVHPDDERYTGLVGKHVILPLVGRRIPIVADEWADPEQGSGAVKITPAHDFNDFEVGKRNNLEMINILDENACINENAPESYQGLDRYEARKRVVADLDAGGFLEKVEPHKHSLPYGDRSNVVIEPWLTDQWYVDAATLAKPAIEAVETGKTEFVPKTWEKTYFEWMRNIQPWCVSRQLWWGHQIPAWYAPDGSVYVEETEEAAYEAARAEHGAEVTLTRDEDVLDTWFSSALWPFGTLGWPDETPELARYYPNSTLVTGFDIIFFWVARMMMDGIHFMGEVPFKTVYIHALVRDEHGAKMSKSKGNVIDPLVFVDRYGADALRFTLAAMESQGRDIKLSEKRVEGYRNFATKLWNASRFAEMNNCVGDSDFEPTSVNLTLNKWIVSGANEAADRVTNALDAFRFNEAADAIYHFAWHTFCDWYLEFAKPIFLGDDEAAANETRQATAWVLDRILTLLHPFMPFVTEELWNGLGRERETDLILGDWPIANDALSDAEANAEMEWVIRLVSNVRTARSEANVPAGAKIPALIESAAGSTRARLQRHGDLANRLARLDGIEETSDPAPKGSVQAIVDEATIILPLDDIIDKDAERARLTKDITKCEKEVSGLERKLSNEGFLSKAPEAVVEENRRRLVEEQDKCAKLKAALDRLN